MASTPRKRNAVRPHAETEEELWLKNEALAAVQDSVAIADATVPDAPLIYVNAAFERVTGYSAIEAVGRPCHFLQGAASDQVAREKLRISLQERRECCVELLNYRKDGKTFLSRIELTPVQNDRGHISHFVMIQSDITEQKRIDEALHSTAKALHTTFVDIQNITEVTRALQTTLPLANRGQFQGVRFASGALRCPDLSGDLANCFPLNDRYIGIYLADIRSRGVPAALNSLMLGQLLCAPAAQSLLYRPQHQALGQYEVCEPVEVMERLRNDSRMAREVIGSLSIAYGVFDSTKHELRYASVGQIGIVLTPDTGDPILLGPAKFPEYLYTETFCEQKVIRMSTGNRVYFCTDGLIDVPDRCGERLGIEGFLKAIDENSCHSLDESVASIVNLVQDWSGTSTPEDDASVLALEIID